MSTNPPTIVELPVDLWINGEKNTTFMCSPFDLEDLALGHLATRGFLRDQNAWRDIDIKVKSNQIHINIKEVSGNIYTIPNIIVSGSSSVYEFTDKIYDLPKVESDFSVELEEVIYAGKHLIAGADIYNSTGGVHGAIISYGSKSFIKEDIGRHCAVDKAIGASIKAGVDFTKAFITTTGRISLDMLLKCAVVGLPLVSSLKYPSDMGVNLANFFGITIVSRVLSGNPIIFGNENRILSQKTQGVV